MSTRLKEKEERIQQVLDALREASANGTPVLIEGKKDVEALRALGIEGTVYSVKTGGKSFLTVIQEIERTGAREVILLLDFDRRGKEGTSRLKQNLERARIKPNVKFWRELTGLLGKDISSVESLPAYLATLRTKIGA